MPSRLKALRDRVSEAARLGATPQSKVSYLAAHYWARLGSHAPFDLPRFELPVKVNCAGRELTAWMRSNNSDWGILRGIFLEREYGIDPPLRGVRRILDLGGNCGYASLYFAAHFPEAEIVAMEPMPENARICRLNFSTNHVSGEVLEAAVGREDGTAELLLTDNEGCQSLVPTHDWKDKLTVRTISVPTVLERRGWDGIDLLKIDIEGYEQVLFQGSPRWLANVGTIVGELHGQYGQPELSRDLKPFGFEVSTLASGYEKTFIARRRS